MEHEKFTPSPISKLVKDDKTIFTITVNRKLWASAISGFFLLLFIYLIYAVSIWLIGEATITTTTLFQSNSPLTLQIFIPIILIIGLIILFGFFFRNLTEFLWSLFGKETITIGDDYISINKNYKFFDKTKTYPSNKIKRLRVDKKEASNIFKLDMLFQPDFGLLAFDYGSTTIKFVSFPEESIANDILDELISLNPNWQNNSKNE